MAADLPNEALSMSDQKKPCSHLDDYWTYAMYAMTGLRHNPDVQPKVPGDEREILYPDRAGRVVDRGIVAAARRPGKYALVAEFVRKMKEDGASAADIETITRALLGDMG